MTVRSALAVRPERPITRPRSAGATRTSSTSPPVDDRDDTWTASGLSTIPLPRCSRAAVSISAAGRVGRVVVVLRDVLLRDGDALVGGVGALRVRGGVGHGRLLGVLDLFLGADDWV